jgi:methyl-accepting chemotaxis protein
MFMDALASVQFQDVTRQQIEQVINALQRLDGHAGLLADRLAQFDDPKFELRPLAHHLDEIYNSYVMSSQRDTHHNALKDGVAAGSRDGPKVELF